MSKREAQVAAVHPTIGNHCTNPSFINYINGKGLRVCAKARMRVDIRSAKSGSDEAHPKSQ
jgi:hypothetical protein